MGGQTCSSRAIYSGWSDCSGGWRGWCRQGMGGGVGPVRRVGVFSQVLARRGWRPRLVESAVASLGYAEQALGGGAAYVGVSAERFLRGYRGVVPGMVVADPPRGGLSRTVRAFFEGQGVPLLVYISCNTATFARDVAHLVWAGYRLTRLAFFDFYPQTPHMEVAGVLSK